MRIIMVVSSISQSGRKIPAGLTNLFKKVGSLTRKKPHVKRHIADQLYKEFFLGVPFIFSLRSFFRKPSWDLALPEGAMNFNFLN